MVLTPIRQLRLRSCKVLAGSEGLEGMKVDNMSPTLVTVCSCRNVVYRWSSMRKWRNTCLHFVRSSASPPRKTHIIQVKGPFNCGHYRFRAARLSRECCRVEVESELCDAHVLHIVSLSPSLLRSIRAVRGFVPRGTLHFFTRVQRVRCSCLRNGLLPFQHGGLWSRASHARRELVRAVGLHPLCPNGATFAEVDRCINIIGQRNGVRPPACVTSSLGRTSRPGDPRSNPQGPAVRLAVQKGERHQLHPAA